jgi:hypothetical protein
MGSLTAIFALVPTAIAPHEQPASLALSATAAIGSTA